MSNRVKIAAGVAVVFVAIVLFAVLRSGGSGGSKSGETLNGQAVSGTPTIRLQGGKPVGGVQDLQIGSGGRLRLRVTSDIAGQVHVHGYDYLRPITAGGNVVFDFPAKLQGAFEIELHHGGGEDTIADLKVVPD